MNTLDLDVSRETIERLELYVALLEKWNPRINLVARSTLNQIWERHFIDSTQIWKYAPDNIRSWSDFGSGGGFPGLVIAILAREISPEMAVTLVESDQRKSTFLRTVARETGVKVTVLDERIEKIGPLNSDVISARALADLKTLLGFADRHLCKGGTALFPKGVNWEKEISEAQETWRFEYEQFTSDTESEAVILRIGEIVHV